MTLYDYDRCEVCEHIEIPHPHLKVGNCKAKAHKIVGVKDPACPEHFKRRNDELEHHEKCRCNACIGARMTRMNKGGRYA